MKPFFDFETEEEIQFALGFGIAKTKFRIGIMLFIGKYIIGFGFKND